MTVKEQYAALFLRAMKTHLPNTRKGKCRCGHPLKGAGIPFGESYKRHLCAVLAKVAVEAVQSVFTARGTGEAELPVL